MCRFIVCIVYIHRYTSFLTEAALTKALSTKPHLFKAGSSRKQTITNANTSCKHLITTFDLN